MITKEMLQAWKLADDFFTVKIENGQAEITFAKKNKDVFGGSRRLSFNSFKGYLDYASKGYFSKNIYDFSKGNLEALRLIVREGDELSFRVIDNVNQYMKKAQIPHTAWEKEDYGYHPDYYGIHADTLTVSVTRKGKNILTDYHLIVSNCVDNSARPVS